MCIRDRENGLKNQLMRKHYSHDAKDYSSSLQDIFSGDDGISACFAVTARESAVSYTHLFGKRFGNGGGVTAAVLECLKEMDENTDIKVARCNGAAECK